MKRMVLALAAAAVLAANPLPMNSAWAASTAQSAEEFRSSKLVGSKVYNQANENIGTIEDFVMKPDGNLSTVVLSVGGFLGIGEKYVSVPFNSLKVGRDGSSIKVTTDGTKESLKALPDYQFYKG